MTYTHILAHGNDSEAVKKAMPSVDDCAAVAEVFKLISDGSRLRILWLLCHREVSVGYIAEMMDMSNPAVSHHLKLLKQSGLVDSRREGKEVFYRLADTEQAELIHRACETMFHITCPTE